MKELSWGDVKEEVKAINKPLYDIIEAIQPTSNQVLYKVKYKFGDLIAKEGTLNVPDWSGRLAPITSSHISEEIKKKIGYRSIPLFMILKNSSEVFVNMIDRIVPLNVFNPGSLLGLFETSDYLINRPSYSIWSISAGCRTLFMLPSLADSQGVNRLRRYYDYPLRVRPTHLHDHFEIFKSIASSPKFDQGWECEILIFSESWLNTSETKLFNFHHYIFSVLWEQSQYALEKVKFSFIWQIFMQALYKRKLNPRPYLSDTIKHLFLIAAKSWPGFCPADDSQRIAPTAGLQHAIMDIYQLKNYLPTLMHLAPLSDVERLFPIYYSLSYPMIMEGSPEHGTLNRIMPDLREIKIAIDTLFARTTTEHEAKLESLSDVKFDYFHSETDIYNEIRKSSEISEEDSRFILSGKNFENRTFCSSSIFWRGCIRVSKK
jgi:hypothetical protein